jgi:putative hemolysin
MIAFLVATFAVISVLLVLVTSVQLLYLEAQRLRSRELPALRYFKETLEDQIGMPADAGSVSFSITKHTLLAVLGVVIFAFLIRIEPLSWSLFLEGCIASWLTMLLCAYALPQLLYRRTNGRWLSPLVPLYKTLALIMRPVTGMIGFFQSLVELGEEGNGHEEQPSSADHIEALISAGAEEGLIEEADRKLIQSAIEFGDTVVREVMTPRPNIVAISADVPLEELRQLVIHEQYSRVPVYDSSIDNIVGFVHVRDMFELEDDERETRTVRELMRPIRAVPETKPVNDLFREMQSEGTHMVVAVDEYGNTAGLATMEDLVEVIFGEIRDEHEPDKDVIEDGSGGYIVSGSFDVARLADLLDFRPNGEIESTTVGGLVSEWLGHVPAPGEFVERGGIRVEVLASDELRVERVRVSKVQMVFP